MSRGFQVTSQAADQRRLPLSEWRSALGDHGVILDPADREYYSTDVYRSGQTIEAVLRPGSVSALQSVVRTAVKAGVAVHARGGGFSYTDAYLARVDPAVCIDTSALNRVVEINSVDRYVTVESGITWAALDAALAAHGLRTPFWGPLSGRNATVGGAISQGAVSLGSSRYGLSGESVLDVHVVAADGTLMHTGSAAQGQHSAFLRGYGPDLTGLFCGDSGALGIKAEVTLRVIPRRPYVHGLSFGCTDFASLSSTMAAIAEGGLATESFGFSAQSLASSASSDGLLDDLRMLWQIGKSSASWWDGLRQMGATALAGRRFLDRVPWTAHCVIEADNRTQLRGSIRALRDQIPKGVAALPNTVPTVIRAEPFQAHDTITPEGHRMLPLHAIFPFSCAEPFHARYGELLQLHESEMAAAKVSASAMFSTVGSSGFLYEPVLMWPDQLSPFHLRHAAPGVQELAASNPDNPQARALVDRLKSDIIDAMFQCGGVHTQIGKIYPYLRDREAGSERLVRAIKSQLDPQGLMNPGALGLD